MRPTVMEWDIIDSRVQREAMELNVAKGRAFLSLALKQICPSTSDDPAEEITDGPDDLGIDAIHMVESENRCDIVIIQSKYRETLDSCSKTINENEILKVTDFLRKLFDKSDYLRKNGNFRIQQAVLRIWEIHDSGKICQYQVIYCSNGGGLSSGANLIAQAFTAECPQVSFEFYGFKELIRDISSSTKTRETGFLRVIGKEILERADGDVRGVIASVDARSYIELITTDDKCSVKRHLFDENLRVFLGAKGGYNPEIINTAMSQDRVIFWYLNNGITITCKNFSYNKGHFNPILKIDEFQIVNGAQTSHSLFEVSRINPELLDDIVLMIRVYATDRVDIAERVAVATNSQARIQSRDLRSNSPILKKLEMAFLERGYFLERKKNMHLDKPSEKRIDALKLGQIIMSYYLKEPDRAKTESDSVFDQRFSYIFNENLNIDDLCRLVNIFSSIEKLRDKYSSDHGDRPESGHPHQYLIYGQWYVLFACRLLCSYRRKSIPIGEDALNLIEDAIRLVSKACAQQKSVAHYQMFRSPKTKEKIIGELLTKQDDFFHLLEPETP